MHLNCPRPSGWLLVLLWLLAMPFEALSSVEATGGQSTAPRPTALGSFSNFSFLGQRKNIPQACTLKGSASLTGWQQAMLDRHNYDRANTDPAASDMTCLLWDDNIATYSQNYANGCVYAHSSDVARSGVTGYVLVGENLLWSRGSSSSTNYATYGATAGTNAVKAWNSEKSVYNAAYGSCTGACGHYTQEVWAMTYALGCGYKLCPAPAPDGYSSSWDFWICNYGEMGNDGTPAYTIDYGNYPVTHANTLTVSPSSGCSSCSGASTGTGTCVASWSNQTTCSATCGSGTYTQKYTVTSGSCPYANGATQTVSCSLPACPVNCVGSFVNGTCSVSCGGGTLTQTFTITTAASNGGQVCGYAGGYTRTLSCNPSGCPKNCIGSWTNGTCSVTCGGGSLTSTYIITQAAANGGLTSTCVTTTNQTTKSLACNAVGCPVNCVGTFVNGSCSTTCGAGSYTATFTITTVASNGGANCAYVNGATISASCNMGSCPAPVNCVGAWSNTSICSATCGSASYTQKYTITTQAANGGTACPAANLATQSLSCNLAACPAAVNCVGAWSNTSVCSATCGTATFSQIYTITTPLANGGTACSATNGATQTLPCNLPGCPVNCVGSWVSTTSCTAPCGGGTLTQTYTITTQALNGGTACPATGGATQQIPCNTPVCLVNCVGGWVTPACPVTCGGALITQTYVITTPSQGGGASCSFSDGTTQQITCNSQGCPVDCIGSYFTDSCTVTCGGGTQVKTFLVTRPDANGGVPCVAVNGTYTLLQCNAQNCPINCVGGYVNTACTKPCGGGTLINTYLYSVVPQYGGQTCPVTNGSSYSATCNTQGCPINCVGNWISSACTKACGGGTQDQTYNIIIIAQNGGAACPYTNGTKQTGVACNISPCPINCVGMWITTSTCTKPCGTGSLLQVYNWTIPAQYGGVACTIANQAVQSLQCNISPCPINCSASWVSGACTKPCGGGSLTQTYTITTLANYGGTACETTNLTTKSSTCNIQACPINCVGVWDTTLNCTASCGTGRTDQKYRIVVASQNGGSACPYVAGATQSLACNTQACPVVNCVGKWTNTTGCYASCGAASFTQTYSIVTLAQNGGTACPYAVGATQSFACALPNCPIDCVGVWSNATNCVGSVCGAVNYTQKYTWTVLAQYNGKACTTANGATKSVSCNLPVCVPVNCVGGWKNDTVCPAGVTCGTAVYNQSYAITVAAQYGGTNCSFAAGAKRQMSCNLPYCPVPCSAVWKNGSCSTTCGPGSLSQTYIISRLPLYGGTNCTAANNTVKAGVACNLKSCPVPCSAVWKNGTCSTTCGAGTLSQTYIISRLPLYGGTNCTAANNTVKAGVACNLKPCPVPCSAAWVNSSCSKTCGAGTLTQTYVIYKLPLYGGTNCTAANMTTKASVACNLRAC